MKYDYLIVGSGLFGSVFAYELTKFGKKCLVIDRRNHIGGNVYCENKEGINVHKYGAHIFHTSNKFIWDYVNGFAEFNNYINSPIANFRGEIYNLPFNMNTFSKMWNISTPDEAREIINEQRKIITGVPRNLQEQAISLVGTDIFFKLVKEYTEKQWGRECIKLPASIIRRLPVRYTYDNNYFDDRYQGIPVGGYNKLIKKLLLGTDVELGVDYLCNRDVYLNIARKIIYTGQIDEYFDYELGPLEYRGLRFETERIDRKNYQGVAVMNFTSKDVPYTRIIEHKHFEFGKQSITYITKEYSCDWHIGDEAYYPIDDTRNRLLYEKYSRLAANENKVVFGGRLGSYKYYNMDQVVEQAYLLSHREIQTLS